MKLNSLYSILITNDVSNLKADEILYSPMCYENGTTVDDLLVYKRGQNDYLLIINAGNIDKDYEWIVENSKKFNVETKNISDKSCTIRHCKDL